MSTVTARPIDEVLAEGRILSAELLAAHRSGDVAGVERLHEEINTLQKEIMRLWRIDTLTATTEENR